MAIVDLPSRKCRPCEGIGQVLTSKEVTEYLRAVPLWTVSDDGKSITRLLVMKNFLAAVHAVDKIAVVAEGENHHPDIHLTKYRELAVTLSTHAMGGLTENDFIVAAKIDSLTLELKQ